MRDIVLEPGTQGKLFRWLDEMQLIRLDYLLSSQSTSVPSIHLIVSQDDAEIL